MSNSKQTIIMINIIIILYPSARHKASSQHERMRAVPTRAQCRLETLHGSLNWFTGLCTFCHYIRGCHSKSFGPRRPSVLRAICSTHCHLSLTILLARSMTLVLAHIKSSNDIVAKFIGINGGSDGGNRSSVLLFPRLSS